MNLYLVLLAFHILSVIAWMAGIMYLPRLFVYHADAPAGGELSETLKVMERRLLRGVMNPAMTATWGFGIALAANGGPAVWGSFWFQIKILFVLGVTAMHMYYARARKRFAIDANARSAKHFRLLNEIPFAFLIGIVFLVILKPFAS